jgi:hypothetical protein
MITCSTVLYSLLFAGIAGTGAANLALGGWVRVFLCEGLMDYKTSAVAGQAISDTNVQCTEMISTVFNSFICEGESTFETNSFYCNDMCDACECASTIEAFCGLTITSMVAGGAIAMIAGSTRHP